MEMLLSALEARLTAKARTGRTPVTAQFELTPTCNLRCQFCYVALDPYKGPYLSTAQVKSVIDKLERAGFLWLILTGGEIFSRRDFPEIYLYAKKKGFLVVLYSNGTMVTEKLATLLREHPPLSVEISIYGADQEHYERVTQIPGSFARFERGMQLLIDAGVPLLMKHPISSLTEHHVPAIAAWCLERRLPCNFSSGIELRHDGGQQPDVYRIASKRMHDVKRNIAALDAERNDMLGVDLTPRETTSPEFPAGPLAECTSFDPSATTQMLYKCSAGKVSVFIDALGMASHCVIDREPAFPILDMEFDELWQRMGDWVTQPLPVEAPCHGCGLRHGCASCPARSRLKTGSPYLKDTYHCDATHSKFGLDPAEHPDYSAWSLPRPLGSCAVAR